MSKMRMRVLSLALTVTVLASAGGFPSLAQSSDEVNEEYGQQELEPAQAEQAEELDAAGDATVLASGTYCNLGWSIDSEGCLYIGG